MTGKDVLAQLKNQDPTISVIILSATGEGFRRGNDKVLRELGQNVGIVWGVRTAMQAGGERA